METNLSPVKANEREIFMDVLRGFAILGIFIANLDAFTWWDFVKPGSAGRLLLPNWDGKMLFLHHMFVEGKFYSIFSFLFGWGISIQLMRSEAQGIKSVSFIRRRLAVMLVLGALHLMIWPGDIVFLYALLGFVLLLFRKLSNKALLITGALLILSPILLYALKMNFPVLNKPSQFLFTAGKWADEKLIGVTSDDSFRHYIRTANWWEIFKGDLSGFFWRYADLFFQSRISKVLGMMLIGMAVGRTNFYKNIAQHKKLLYYIIGFGILVALPANYILARYMQAHDGSYYNLTAKGLYRTIAYAIGVAPLAAAYIAIFMFSFRTTAGGKILSFLAPVGKMAFTNYIMHTLIGNFVFLNAGLGYMERVGPVYYTVFAMVVFVFQIIISTVWLRYFNYGPVEWLWRSGTYGKWQEMRKGNGE